MLGYYALTLLLPLGSPAPAVSPSPVGSAEAARLQVHADALRDYARGSRIPPGSGVSVHTDWPVIRPPRHVCEYDLVVLARMERSAGQLSASGDLIFTESEVSIDRVLHLGDRKASAPAHIQVIRPGGGLLVLGQSTSLNFPEFPPLPKQGVVVLFLTKLPTGGFVTAGPEDALSVDFAQVIRPLPHYSGVVGWPSRRSVSEVFERSATCK
jgi:hypothetical protein